MWVPVSLTTKELVDFQNLHEKVCAYTVKKMLQVEHLMKNAVVDAARVRREVLQM